MKRNLFVFVLVVCAFNACAQRMATNTRDKQVILKLNRELTDPFLSCDRLDQLLADDYSYIGIDGSVQNKTQAIDSCKSLAIYPESIRPQPKVESHADVRFYQDVAVVTGKQTVEQQIGRFSDWVNKTPTKLVDEIRFTQFWVERNNRWQLVQAQATKLPPSDGQ